LQEVNRKYQSLKTNYLQLSVNFLSTFGQLKKGDLRERFSPSLSRFFFFVILSV